MGLAGATGSLCERYAAGVCAVKEEAKITEPDRATTMVRESSAAERMT